MRAIKMAVACVAMSVALEGKTQAGIITYEGALTSGVTVFGDVTRYSFADAAETGPLFNSLISDFVLPATGNYTVAAYDFLGDDTGP
jgi:hypothetical protein